MKRKFYKSLLVSALAFSVTLTSVPLPAFAEEASTTTEESQTTGDDAAADNQQTTGTENGSNSDNTTSGDQSAVENNQSGTESNNQTAVDQNQQDTVQSESDEQKQNAAPSVDVQQDAENTAAVQSAKATADEKVVEIHASEGITGRELSAKLTAYFGVSAYGYGYVKDGTENLIDISSKKYEYSSGTLMIKKRIKTGGSIFKPVYGWEDAGNITIKNYYNASFNVTSLEGAGVQIDGQDVTGTVKVFDTADTLFTVKSVAGYDTTVKIGDTEIKPEADGVSYKVPALTADAQIDVVYAAQTGVNVNITNPENGTIKINGASANTKVALNTKYTITVEPKEGCAVEEVFVNGTSLALSYENQVASATLDSGDTDGATFEVTANVIQCKLDVKDAEINYREGFSKDKIEENIFNAMVGTDNVPQISKDDVTIEYDAGNNNWKPVDYVPTGLEQLYCHKFGRTLYDIKEKDTEKIRITYKDSSGIQKYPTMSKTATVTLKDLRQATTLTINDGIMMKYQSTDMMDAVIKVLIAQNATVTDGAGNVIPTTADDFTYSPSTDEWSAGEQEITVTYKGNDDYLSSQVTTTITIKKGDATVWVNSQNIKYGEQFSQVFASDPEEANPIGMIVGIDGNGKTFVGFDVSNVKIKKNVPIIGKVEIPLEEVILELVPSGNIKVGDLSKIIEQLPEDSDGIISAVKEIVSTITEIYPAAEDFTISFKHPTESGVYLAVGASTSQNYNTAAGVGYLTIAPQTENVKLEFNTTLPQGNILTYEEAQSFDFGGKATQSGSDVQANVKAKYYGMTDAGKVVSSTEPIREPGYYVETVYTKGGNYLSTPIFRSYAVKKAETVIKFDVEDSHVTYDGKPHGLTAGVYYGDTRIADAEIKYLSSSGYSSSEAPTNAAMYQVIASYKGDATYAGVEAVYTRLYIDQRPVTIKADDMTIAYRDEINLTYTIEGEGVKEAELGNITVSKVENGDTPGTYTLRAATDKENPNYKYNYVDGTLEITKRPIRLEVVSVETVYGQTLPTDVTDYVAIYKGGSAGEIMDDKVTLEDLQGAVLTYTDSEDQPLPEKPDAGVYEDVVKVTGFTEDTLSKFEIKVEAGRLIVDQRPVAVTIDSKKKTEGEADPELTYTTSAVEGTAESGLLDGDDLGLKLIREAGETVGLYDIIVDLSAMNPNYVMASGADGADKFEIVKAAVKPAVDPGKNNPKKDNTNKNNTTKKVTPASATKIAKTGDNANPVLYIAGSVIALAAIVFVLLRRRKRK